MCPLVGNKYVPIVTKQIGNYNIRVVADAVTHVALVSGYPTEPFPAYHAEHDKWRERRSLEDAIQRFLMSAKRVYCEYIRGLFFEEGSQQERLFMLLAPSTVPQNNCAVRHNAPTQGGWTVLFGLSWWDREVRQMVRSEENAILRLAKAISEDFKGFLRLGLGMGSHKHHLMFGPFELCGGHAWKSPLNKPLDENKQAEIAFFKKPCSNCIKRLATIIGADPKCSTPQEIVDAYNTWRKKVKK